MIKIETIPSDNPLTGQSKWWGQPDMPEELEFPEMTVIDLDGKSYKETLTFVCQIRCEDIAPFDTDNQLPHKGMLYFFAALDYFLGDIENPTCPGLGMWEPQYFKVLYSESCENLHTHQIIYEDGSPAHLPAEKLTFSSCCEADDGIRLLGQSYIDDVRQYYPQLISLLQIDESDRWNLRFYDCGMLNFLISSDDLRNRRWDKVKCHLFSF